MADRLDLLILGATGFTGKHCIIPVHKLSKANGRNLTWGVAGRSEEKLKAVLQEMGEQIGADLQSIPIIITDIKDEQSLAKMAQRTKVVINCCGPYRFLGNAVVKACVEAGTHHVDVSGEVQYIEKIQSEQHEKAAEKGVYVVSACGFDSIPADLGVVYLQQHFQGTLNSVETYLKGWWEGSSSGPAVNFGTWESAVYGLWTQIDELKMKLGKKMFSNRLTKFEPELQIKILPHSVPFEDGYVVPFPGPDSSVIRRSQKHFYEKKSQRPVQVETYLTIDSLVNLLLLAFFGAIFVLLTSFSFGRNLLLKYPGLFSGGLFGTKQPTEEQVNNTMFSVTLYGEGWKEKLSGPDDKYTTPMNRCVLGKVQGRNPGYGATCVALVLSGILVLTEKEKLPGKGGVYPPGAAFAKTSMIKELNENGVSFEIIYQKDL